MEIPADARRLLTETAMLASILNDTGRARRILAGLDEAAPGAPASVVAHALADLTDGNADRAADRLRPLADAGDQGATVLLAVALKAGGRTGECDALVARSAGVYPVLEQLAATLR